jgi:hypothetical protein
MMKPLNPILKPSTVDIGLRYQLAYSLSVRHYMLIVFASMAVLTVLALCIPALVAQGELAQPTNLADVCTLTTTGEITDCERYVGDYYFGWYVAETDKSCTFPSPIPAWLMTTGEAIAAVLKVACTP